jgi:hypothetical protein
MTLFNSIAFGSAERGAGLIERAKRVKNAVPWTLTRANRDQIPARVLGWLGSA